MFRLIRHISMTEAECNVLRYVLRYYLGGVEPPLYGATAGRLLGRLDTPEPEPVMRMLKVSTGHLTGQEREWLADLGLAGQRYCGDHGGIVSTGPYHSSEIGDLPDGASATMAAVMREAIRRGCGCVCFEPDAEPLPGFPMLEKDDDAVDFDLATCLEETQSDVTNAIHAIADGRTSDALAFLGTAQSALREAREVR